MRSRTLIQKLGVCGVITMVLWLSAGLQLRADPVDDYVRAEMKKRRIPGLALAGGQGWESHQAKTIRPGECGTKRPG
jgi:hypothetical protein